MTRFFYRLGLIAAMFSVIAITGNGVSAKGYLAVKPTELEELVIGLGDTGFGISEKHYLMETGKSYKLEIKSTGYHECALEAPDFFNFIWLRKIEINNVEIKASHLYEIEFEREGEAEIFFVPIKPGKYPFACRGMESRGMTGIFEVR